MKNFWRYCTLEQSRKLVELGIDRNVSAAHFSKPAASPERPFYLRHSSTFETMELKETYPAFDCSELGIMLDTYVMPFWIRFSLDEQFCQILVGNERYTYSGKTEAEARANLLIALLSGEITTTVTANKVNDRFQRFLERE